MNVITMSTVIEKACQAIAKDDIDKGKEIINDWYPFVPNRIDCKPLSDEKKLQVFMRDGFIDRYSGERLVFQGTLQILSLTMPKEFPYHAHGKTDMCHNAWWELYPSIEHIQPVAYGGNNDLDNLITVSQIRNNAKGSIPLHELGWSLVPCGNIAEWDGMVHWFIDYVETHKDMLNVAYISNWYKVCNKVL